MELSPGLSARICLHGPLRTPGRDLRLDCWIRGLHMSPSSLASYWPGPHRPAVLRPRPPPLPGRRHRSHPTAPRRRTEAPLPPTPEVVRPGRSGRLSSRSGGGAGGRRPGNTQGILGTLPFLRVNSAPAAPPAGRRSRLLRRRSAALCIL